MPNNQWGSTKTQTQTGHPPSNIRVTLGNSFSRYNSGDPTSISYKLHFWRQFTTKWKLVLIQNGMSNLKIMQFGSKNARSGTHRVFPIRLPMNTIWCVSSFLIPCNFHSTTIWSGWPFFDFPQFQFSLISKETASKEHEVLIWFTNMALCISIELWDLDLGI